MTEFNWPEDAEMAVSLSFDDARQTQLDVGIPLLAEYQAQATFYVIPAAVEGRLAEWQAAEAAGHEIGNHTWTHACTGCYPFSASKALESYDLEWMAADISRAQSWLSERFAAPRSFAYPCGQTFVGRGRDNRSYIPLIAERFVAGRTFDHPTNNAPGIVDLAQVWSHDMDRMTPDTAVRLLNAAREQRSWLIFAGHNVAPGTGQDVDPATLRAICTWCRNPENRAWLAPVADIATHIQEFSHA